MIRWRTAVVAGGGVLAAVIAIAPSAAVSAARVAFADHARDSQRVGGLLASRTPHPHQLVALDWRGQLPATAVNGHAGSKHTYTGVVSVESTAPAGTATADPTKQFRIGTGITLPQLAKRLAGDHVGVLGGGLELPDCVGDNQHPTAPPGELCIYPGVSAGGDVSATEADIQNVALNGEGAFEVVGYPLVDGLNGARIEVLAAGPGVVRFSAAWAYTAP